MIILIKSLDYDRATQTDHKWPQNITSQNERGKKEIAFSNSSTTIKVGVVNPRGQQRWKPLAD